MIKLNIGSGNKRINGYLNIDSDAGCDPDYILDLETDTLPFDDNSVDGVLLHHILEHLGDGFFHFVKELYRVCKHGTIIDVQVPHPRHDTFLIDPTHKRPIYPHTLDMFSKSRNKKDMDAGGCETPIGFINDVDMYVIDFRPVLDDYWIQKFQLMDEAQCDYTARTFNNVVLAYDIKWFVNKENVAERGIS